LLTQSAGDHQGKELLCSENEKPGVDLTLFDLFQQKCRLVFPREPPQKSQDLQKWKSGTRKFPECEKGAIHFAE
jgi:hypothetical protein